jgi:DnaJ-class molecular chaperone
VTRSPTSQDYWSVLGLSPGADGSTLKRAFRTQARRWHPDLNANDPRAEDQFKLVNEAYAVLSDPLKRQVWEAAQAEIPDSAAGRSDGDPFARGFPDFEDYLAELFGDRRAKRREREIPYEPDRGSDRVRERAQDGPSAGQVATAPATPPPVAATTDLESVVELTPEQALQGERIELELANGTCIEVWTPPFAGDGWRLRLQGVATGGADHFLQLRVRTADGLRVDGLRILYKLELTPAEAALGCGVVVPTLRGPVKMTVPAGSSSGRLLRLRGRGLEWSEQRGDQLVEIKIVVPEELSEAEVALYRRLEELAQGA